MNTQQTFEEKMSLVKSILAQIYDLLEAEIDNIDDLTVLTKGVHDLLEGLCVIEPEQPEYSSLDDEFTEDLYNAVHDEDHECCCGCSHNPTQPNPNKESPTPRTDTLLSIARLLSSENIDVALSLDEVVSLMSLDSFTEYGREALGAMLMYVFVNYDNPAEDAQELLETYKKILAENQIELGQLYLGDYIDYVGVYDDVLS